MAPPNTQPTLPGEGVYNDLELLFIAEQPKNLWPQNQNSNLGAIRKTVTDVLTLAVTQISELALERFIETASGYLSRWEEQLGLPKNPTGKSLAERRALIMGRKTKGPFTRTRRREIVEAHITATFGTSPALVPEGIPLTADGIALFSDVGSVEGSYTITENVEDFSYAIEIDSAIDPDLVSMNRELRRITPAWINFTVGDLVDVTPTKAISTGGGIWFFGAADVDADLDMVVSAGAEFVRMDMYWRDVETADGTFNWTQPDRMFDAADARGLKVQFIIHRTPSWARGGAGSDLTYPTLASSYGDFCQEVVNRYKARGTLGCHHWEFWNEPNGNWAASDVTDTGAAKLAAMINDAVPKMRAADATCVIIGPGIARGGSSGSSSNRLDTEYAAALYTQGMNLGLLDAMGYHPYSMNGTAFDPGDTGNADVGHGFNRIDDMKSALVTAGDDIPIMLTEWGQHTGTHVEAVSEAVQATYIQNAWDRYKLYLADGTVTGPLFLYQHRDGGTVLANKEENFGLTKRDRVTHKPARATFIGLS